MPQRIGNGFEILEDRILLAAHVTATADVTATLSNGTLTITGDATANSIDVTGTGVQGGIEVSLTNGQSLKVTGGCTLSSAAGQFSCVTNVVINDGNGNDYLQIDDLNITGNLTATQGSGMDLMYAYGLTLGGNLSLAEGGGNNDTINFYASSQSTSNVEGNATAMEGGGANDLIEFNAPNKQVFPVGGGGLSNLNVAGNVTHANSEGKIDSIGGKFTTGSIPSLYIGGNVTTTEGSGAGDHLYMYGLSLDGCLANAQGSGNDFSYVGASHIRGNLTITEGAGHDSSEVTDVGVAGNATVTEGSGNDAVLLYGMTVEGNLSFTEGSGSDYTDIVGVSVGGNLTGTGGAGEDFMEISNLQIVGCLSLTEGSGSDDLIELEYYGPAINNSQNVGYGGTTIGTASFKGTGAYGYKGTGLILGSLSITEGSGNNDFIEVAAHDATKTDNLNVAGNVTAVQGGGNNDQIAVIGYGSSTFNVGGNLQVTEGAGTNNGIDVYCYGESTAYFGGSVSLNTGTGSRTRAGIEQSLGSSLTVNGSLTVASDRDYVDSVGHEGGSVSLGGNVTFSVNSVAGGTGYGVLSSYGDAVINVGGNVAINGGTGSDRLGLSVTGSEYGFGKNIVTQGMTLKGNVVINGNSGNDTIEILDNGRHADYGLITAQHGYGFDCEIVAIGGNVTLNGNGKGNDKFDVVAYGSVLNVAGNLTLCGGTGNDTMSVQGSVAHGDGTCGGLLSGQVNVAKSFAATSGTGTNTIGVADLSVIGSASFQGGANSVFDLFDSKFGGQVTLDGQGNNDLFDIQDNVFASNLTVTGGGTNDGLYFDPDNVVHGSKTFSGVKTLKSI